MARKLLLQTRGSDGLRRVQELNRTGCLSFALMIPTGTFRRSIGSFDEMTMDSLTLEDWLRQRSIKVERNGPELIFTHFTGETSILLPRDTWRDNLISFDCDWLASFYDDLFGASIGNSQIIIGTNVRGGIDISHGCRLPDLDQLADKARALGIVVPAAELPFIAEAGYMFFYTVRSSPAGFLFRVHDRDFGTSTRVTGFWEVLENWWTMIRSR